MTFNLSMQLLDGRSRIGRLDEDNHRSLAIPPHEVSEQLIDRLVDGLRTAPVFEFGDEDIPVVMSDEDVSLALSVEEFTAGSSAPETIKRAKEQVAQFFLI